MPDISLSGLGQPIGPIGFAGSSKGLEAAKEATNFRPDVAAHTVTMTTAPFAGEVSVTNIKVAGNIVKTERMLTSSALGSVMKKFENELSK